MKCYVCNRKWKNRKEPHQEEIRNKNGALAWYHDECIENEDEI